MLTVQPEGKKRIDDADTGLVSFDFKTIHSSTLASSLGESDAG